MTFVPADREYVPSPAAQQRSEALLRGFAPDADEVSATAWDVIRFIDCGGNWSGVSCPACGADAESWFGDQLGNCNKKSGFRDLAVIAPCCGATVYLDTLTFGWPIAFARFALDVRNPARSDLAPDQRRSLEDAVGCALKVVWRHY